MSLKRLQISIVRICWRTTAILGFWMTYTYQMKLCILKVWLLCGPSSKSGILQAVTKMELRSAYAQFSCFKKWKRKSLLPSMWVKKRKWSCLAAKKVMFSIFKYDLFLHLHVGWHSSLKLHNAQFVTSQSSAPHHFALSILLPYGILLSFSSRRNRILWLSTSLRSLS